MIYLDDKEVKPTIFPDKTSQVWKLEFDSAEPLTVTWEFESEDELFHICQLADLIKYSGGWARLHMPYLPYGRQDKDISNDNTFALHTFAKIINTCDFASVSFIDGHSLVAKQLINRSRDIFPIVEIENAQGALSNDLDRCCMLAYPDQGACVRYSKVLGEHDCIIGTKVRNQHSGYITHFEMEGDPRGQDVLIIDDICDGGMTFKIMAGDLLDAGAESVHLYVTHGIFSKGLETLRESGIQRIFTRKGEIDAYGQ